MKNKISSADVIIASLSVLHHETDKEQHGLVLKKMAQISGLSVNTVKEKYSSPGMREDIDKYKKGELSSKDFIKILYNKLFLDEDSIEEKSEEIVEAWNLLIKVDENSKKNLQYLISLGKPVFLIADTNYLNVHKIIFELNKINLTDPKNSQAPNLELPLEENIIKKQGILLTTNINLITSFQYGSFKQEGLLDQLANDIKDRVNKILIISNNQNDLTKLNALLPKEKNCTTISLEEFISLNSSTNTTSQKKDASLTEHNGFFEKKSTIDKKQGNKIVTLEENTQSDSSEDTDTSWKQMRPRMT